MKGTKCPGAGIWVSVACKRGHGDDIPAWVSGSSEATGVEWLSSGDGNAVSGRFEDMHHRLQHPLSRLWESGCEYSQAQPKAEKGSTSNFKGTEVFEATFPNTASCNPCIRSNAESHSAFPVPAYVREPRSSNTMRMYYTDAAACLPARLGL
jgi:hypothetical protein